MVKPESPEPAPTGRRVITVDDLTLGDRVWFDESEPAVLVIRNLKTSSPPDGSPVYRVLPGERRGVLRFVPATPNPED